MLAFYTIKSALQPIHRCNDNYTSYLPSAASCRGGLSQNSQNLADIPPFLVTGTSCKSKATTAIITATTAEIFVLQWITLRKDVVTGQTITNT